MGDGGGNGGNRSQPSVKCAHGQPVGRWGNGEWQVMSVPEQQAESVESPPRTLVEVLRRLGPGLIIAASIVGSGELIATTITGARAGFWLMWLIVVGCLIKVCAQIELGRFSMVTGQTTMDGLSQVPGPRIAGRGNWIVWYWFLMFLASISQLGGIVGAVGQALTISIPLTQEGREFNQYVKMSVERQIAATTLDRTTGATADAEAARHRLEARIAELDAERARRDQRIVARVGAERFAQLGHRPPPPIDDRLWALIMALGTAVILVVGRYRAIQGVSTAMVAAFTFVTVLNVIMLQTKSAWAISWTEIWQGMQFRLPPTGARPVATALATVGIIGVGAAELVAYPYWCLEKGYARFTGPRDASSAWVDRARGWMRVMQWDAWCSAIVYTFATVAFYVLGAAVLGRSGLDPKEDELIQTLTTMYEPVFGPAAGILFLFGAFAVLYSTYFVANAGHARVFSDALRVLGLAAGTEAGYRRRVRVLSGLFPLACLVIYVGYPNPVGLVFLSGVMQAIMLPMLAFAALFFRYRRCDARIAPGRAWDSLLWLSAAGMLVAGAATLVSKFMR